MKTPLFYSRYIRGLFALLIVLAIAGCSSSSSPTSPTTPGSGGGSGTKNGSTVSIRGLAFNPASLTVTAGTTVTWTNNDGVDHTVTSTGSPSFTSSGHITPGSTFSVTFSTPGTYSYMCSIHTFMHGSVTVTGQTGGTGGMGGTGGTGGMGGTGGSWGGY